MGEASNDKKIQEMTSFFHILLNYEIRTPLIALIAFAELVLKEAGETIDKQQKDDLHMVKKNGQKINDVINLALEILRVENNTFNLSMEEANIRRVLEDCQINTSKTFNLDIYLADSLPTVWVDKTALRQIILNGISFASNNFQNGTVTLRTMYDKQWVTLEISNPHMILPDYLLSTYQKIKSGESLFSTLSLESYNLGLSQVLMKMQKGNLNLESKSGLGTVFTLTLPIYN